ncbi:MAG: hypothetical protein Q8916_06745 [Bacteroidota bacterium]|nr:hypothetical protein [Bacteroidota bacterium]MDP4230089.1 hypothetical protein [Bacteroidota bacterium]MDP4236162.1 hypothetical protein [Bacteroidota bacterium]
MNRTLLAFICAIVLLGSGCGKKEGHGHGSRGTMGAVHAPTSATDSIKFTPDTAGLRLLLFCPLGGTNHVVVHDLTTNSDLFNSNVSTTEEIVTGFTPGDNYYVLSYFGNGTSTFFTHVTSSYRNSVQSPTPFTGYTQYFNNSGTQGPGDGVVVIMQEPD